MLGYLPDIFCDRSLGPELLLAIDLATGGSESS